MRQNNLNVSTVFLNKKFLLYTAVKKMATLKKKEMQFNDRVWSRPTLVV